MSKEVEKMGITGLLPGQRLIGFYYTTNTAAEILNTGYAASSSFCKAMLYSTSVTEAAAQVRFKKLVAAAKADLPVDRSKPDVDRLLKHYEDAARQIKNGVEMKVLDVSFLNCFIDSDTTYAASVLASYARKESGRTLYMPFAVANAWLLEGKDIFQITVAWPFGDASDVTNSKIELLAWLENIKSAASETTKAKVQAPANDSAPAKQPTKLTPEQKRKVLVYKGLDPDRYDFDETTGHVFEKASAVASTTNGITLPEAVRYLITLTEPGGEQTYYFSEREPKPYGNGYKIILYPLNTEMIISGSIKIVKVK